MRAKVYRRIRGLLKDYENIDVDDERYNEYLNDPENAMFSWDEFIYGKEIGSS